MHGRGPVDLALAVAKATNVPLLVLAAERYEVTLHEELARLDADHPHSVIRLGPDVVQDVRSNVNARHLVMVTTTGPRLRFRSSLGTYPAASGSRDAGFSSGHPLPIACLEVVRA